MRNLNSLLNQDKNLKLVGYTSVWNFHTCDHLGNLAKKKGTNINKAVEEMKKTGKKGSFTLYVDSIGRSGHSASRVAILEGVSNVDTLGSFYYSSRLGEFFIN